MKMKVLGFDLYLQSCVLFFLKVKVSCLHSDLTLNSGIINGIKALVHDN